MTQLPCRLKGRRGKDKSRSRESRNMAQVDESITRSAAPHRCTANLSRALGSLADRGMLSANPLTRLEYVQRLAADKYRDRIMPRGLALRDIVSGCVDRIVAEVANEPRLDRAAKYLVLRSRGLSGQRIAAELRLSREHVARTVRRQALQLLLEQFLLMTRGGQR